MVRHRRPAEHAPGQLEFHDLPTTGAGRDTGAVLALLHGDPLHERERHRIAAAILADGQDHGGEVDADRVRTALTGPHGLTVFPRLLSSSYAGLARAGVLAHTGWKVSEDRTGGNAGRPARVWRLAGRWAR